MAEFDDVRSKLESTMAAGWDDSLVPVIWDNDVVSPPSSGSWVRVTITWLPSENIEIGVNKVLIRGFFTIQVFTELGIGAGESARIVDRINTLMQNKSLLSNNNATILTYAADVRRIGDGIRRVDQIERGQYQVNVNIPVEAY